MLLIGRGGDCVLAAEAVDDEDGFREVVEDEEAIDFVPDDEDVVDSDELVVVEPSLFWCTTNWALYLCNKWSISKSIKFLI